MKWKLYNIAWILRWLSYLDSFTETSTGPNPAVAAVDLGEQGPSSISEAVCYPDVTTAQQRIVGDAMCPNKETGKNSSRKPRISESIILEWCLMCKHYFTVFPVQTFIAQCTTVLLNYSFKKCIQMSMYLHLTLQGKALRGVLHSIKADCSMSNSGVRHRNKY